MTGDGLRRAAQRWAESAAQTDPWPPRRTQERRAARLEASALLTRSAVEGAADCFAAVWPSAKSLARSPAAMAEQLMTSLAAEGLLDAAAGLVIAGEGAPWARVLLTALIAQEASETAMLLRRVAEDSSELRGVALLGEVTARHPIREAEASARAWAEAFDENIGDPGALDQLAFWAGRRGAWGDVARARQAASLAYEAAREDLDALRPVARIGLSEMAAHLMDAGTLAEAATGTPSASVARAERRGGAIAATEALLGPRDAGPAAILAERRGRTPVDLFTGPARPGALNIYLQAAGLWTGGAGSSRSAFGAFHAAALRLARERDVPVALQPVTASMRREPEPGAVAISFNSFSERRQDGWLHAHYAYLPGYMQLDRGGLFGWSDLAQGAAPAEPWSARVSDLEIRLFHQMIFGLYGPGGLTTQSQPLDVEWEIPRDLALLVALPGVEDFSQLTAEIDAIDLIAGAAAWARRRGEAIAIKRHPLCRSPLVTGALEAAADEDGPVFVTRGPIAELISRARAVATVNSAVGFEALVGLRPVIVTGPVDYQWAARRVSRAEDLSAAFDAAVDEGPLAGAAAVRAQRFVHFYLTEVAVNVTSEADLAAKLAERAFRFLDMQERG